MDFWTELADSICRDVFDREYSGLLGLPMPKIAHLDPTHESYSSGQYFITLGNGWQIHLNLGRLPLQKEDFEREFRVLLRHEIEHYRTCPFNLPTHFRMMKVAFRICKNRKLAAEIVNQVSDIIVDTHNYLRCPRDTAWSERLWIRKSSEHPLHSHPQSSSLMFLVKQGLWKIELLPRFHIEDSLQAKIDETVLLFETGGVTDASTLLQKVEHYTSLLTQLLIEDGRLLSIAKDKSDGLKAGEILSDDEQAIMDAIADLAQESNIHEFSAILGGSGFNKTEKEIQKIWYEQNCSHTFELPYKIPRKGEAHMAYPITWRISDPPDNLDLLLSLQTSPVIIPNITTKKWFKNESPTPESSMDLPGLLLMIDSSSSMEWNADNPESPYHVALLAAFSLLEYYEKMKGDVAGINFSEHVLRVEWSCEYDKLKSLFLKHIGSATIFPIETVRQLIDTGKKRILIILTDDELSNWKDCQHLFFDLMDNGHKILLFLIRKKAVDFTLYDSFISSGGRLYVMQDAEDVYSAAIGEI